MIISNNQLGRYNSESNHIVVTLFNTETYELKIPLCETGDAKIYRQTEFADNSNLIRDPRKAFEVSYFYRPEAGFKGEDSVELVIFRTKMGFENEFSFEKMKIEFIVIE